jgi:cytochrome c2
MKYASALFVLILLTATCTTTKKKPPQTLLTPRLLESQVFNIEPGKAQTIRTKNGATIQLPENALELAGSGPVQLEIREAYTLEAMLLAGLVTESNGRPLSSGGMIYLSARQNNRDIALQKKAVISIPLTNYSAGMQVYKGRLNGDSTINWVQPRALDSTPDQLLASGKQLFMSNCASCHGIKKTGAGPALENILNRVPSRKWLYAYTRNWRAAFEFKDSTGFNYSTYSCCKSQLTPTEMPSFPSLSDSALDAIYLYIQSESASLVNTNADICAPCLLLKEDIGEKQNTTLQDAGVQEQSQNNTLLDDAGQEQLQTNTLQKPAEWEGQLRKGFTDMPVSGEYTFSIETLGWYNIDADYAGLPGTTLCSVDVTVSNPPASPALNVYLLAPAKKNLSVSNSNIGNVYSFSKVDGKIPLHLNDGALVLAFAEQGGKVLYGIRFFNVQQSNQLQVALQEAGSADFEKIIAGLRFDGLNMQVQTRKQMEADVSGSPSTKDSSAAIIATPPAGTVSQADTGRNACPCGSYY